MKIMVMVVIISLLFGCGSTEVVEETPTLVIDTNSVNAKKAYEYLNLVRSNPSQYRCTDCNFDRFEARKPLTTSIVLQSIAWKRAIDMAKRGYTTLLDSAKTGIDIFVLQNGYEFDSTNYDKTSSNYGTATFSYTADINITSMIADLIRGPGRFSSGDDFNRYYKSQHLLMGLYDNERLDEIGIGFCYTYNKSTKSNYKYYLCVIIAKRKK